MTKICFIGASYLWTRTLVCDLLHVFGEEAVEIRFLDLVEENALICKQWGEAASKAYGRDGDRYLAFTDRRRALEGADAVLITISTGGLDAMEWDITIPEKYGIYATVGDTAGPSGWSRSIRNIPVFMDFAKDIRELCPQAFVANYTNPMSTTTAVLDLLCPNPVAGFCHSYMGVKDFIQLVFGLEDWSQISLEIAGMNHFIWVTGFKIGRQDGYELLREKTKSRSLRDFIPKAFADEIGFESGNSLFVDLYEMYGYLPCPGDRHINEFLSFLSGYGPVQDFISQSPSKSYGGTGNFLAPYGIERTPTAWRRERLIGNKQKMLEATEQLRNTKVDTIPVSRETGGDVVWSYLHNKPIVDAVNTLNVGQIEGLPEGACVETLGVVDGFGVRPMMVSKLPENLLEIMRPQAICTKWITDGMIHGDRNMVLQGLYRDPQCSHMRLDDLQRMANELLEANAEYVRLP